MPRFPTSTPSLLATVIIVLALTLAATFPAGAATHVRPVPGEMTRPYDPPEQNWLPGHRGVDLAGTEGEPVHSSGVGTVHFAGMIAGTPTVSVLHTGGFRTTYQPVRAEVEAGEAVVAGQRIGTLGRDVGHPGLHWGALYGQTDYFNPLDLLGRRMIVLKPVP